MAWSAPMTAVANATFTAAQFNQFVRDNLLETGPAKAGAAGRYLVTKGVNSIGEGTVNEPSVLTSETTSSTSYTNLATAGPNVTTTTGTSAFVTCTAFMSNSSAGAQCFMSFVVSGATTLAESDVRALRYESGAANDSIRASMRTRVTLTAGSNTFTARYRVDAGTGTFAHRFLTVEAF